MDHGYIEVLKLLMKALASIDRKVGRVEHDSHYNYHDNLYEETIRNKEGVVQH